MAGVAEMLIQSHEGFIELLPALPKAWETGRFNGLLARGNFELSAKWEKGNIYQLEIISKVGGECKIKLPDDRNVKIIDSSKQEIPFSKVAEKTIQFSTMKSGKYLINMGNN